MGVFVPIVYAASDIKIEGDMQLLNLRDFVIATLVKNEFQILQVCKNKSECMTYDKDNARWPIVVHVPCDTRY